MNELIIPTALDSMCQDGKLAAIVSLLKNRRKIYENARQPTFESSDLQKTFTPFVSETSCNCERIPPVSGSVLWAVREECPKHGWSGDRSSSSSRKRKRDRGRVRGQKDGGPPASSGDDSSDG